MIKMALRLVLIISVTASIAFAAPAPAFAKQNVDTEALDPSREVQWLSIGAGALIGFGIGQAGVGRYGKIGWVFTVADSLAWFSVLSSFGDCNPSQRYCSSSSMRDFARTSAIGALVISRGAQVADLLIFGSEHGLFGPTQKKEEIAVVPTSDGRGLQTVAALHF